MDLSNQEEVEVRFHLSTEISASLKKVVGAATPDLTELQLLLKKLWLLAGRSVALQVTGGILTSIINDSIKETTKEAAA